MAWTKNLLVRLLICLSRDDEVTSIRCYLVTLLSSTQKQLKPYNFLSTMKYLDQPLEPDPVIEAYKKDIDRTLLRENLKLTYEQRLLKLMELQRFAEELRRAGQRVKQKT